MQPDERRDSDQNSPNYFNQPTSQPIELPINPTSPFSQQPQQPQPQFQSQPQVQSQPQPQFQPYASNNLTPIQPAKKKSNIKSVVIIAAIVLLLGVGIFILFSFLNKDSSKTDVSNDNGSSGANVISNSSDGTLIVNGTEMDRTEVKNTSANFEMSIPKGWELYNDQLPQTYNNNNNLEEQNLFYLAIDGYAKEFSGDYTETPIDGLPSLLDKQITNDIPEIADESLHGTELSQEIVTLNGMDLLKVTGKTTAYEPHSYIAYFGYNTSVKWKTTNVPFVVMMFIKGDNQADIARGEKILNDCMATFKSIEE